MHGPGNPDRLWDPALDDSLARAGGRIAGFHVHDRLVPTRDGDEVLGTMKERSTTSC